MKCSFAENMFPKITPAWTGNWNGKQSYRCGDKVLGSRPTGLLLTPLKASAKCCLFWKRQQSDTVQCSLCYHQAGESYARVQALESMQE